MIRVALYTHERTLHSLLSSALGKDFKVVLETSEDGMKRQAEERQCDVFLLDLNPCPEPAAEDLESLWRLIDGEIPALILAGDPSRATAFELVRAGAFGYCRRPPSIRELKTLLCRAHEKTELKREIEGTAQRDGGETGCDGLIGRSEPMQRVYRLIRQVADLNASVLIAGESGTGKELIARAVHSLGSRSNRPFVAVSCGAIPETLIEAELFGHEKGAFTGAMGAREGYLEQAADGTLFLDEIGDLSLYTQVKLLRVLQQLEFNRLGGSKTIRLRARLVFATHRNLPEMVARGTFRQDLFYRMNVVRIEAPPLRERTEDVGAIATHFLHSYSAEFRKPMERIEPEALRLLERYGWPGNVRELENTIQRAIILASGGSVRAEDLPAAVRGENVIELPEYSAGGSFERLLNEYKYRLATAAVREHNGNKTLAARSLQISRAYLHRLIRGPEGEGEFDTELRETRMG